MFAIGSLRHARAVPDEYFDKRWVLFVGRLDPIKDPELAVDAFAEIARDQAMSG